jgi:hypothetical protein
MLLAAATLVTGGLSIAPAGAATVQTCKKVTGSATLTPGLGATPKTQTVTAKANATGCLPLKATGGSGVFSATSKVPNGSCGSLAKGGTSLKLASTIKWKNGKTSKLALVAKTGTGSNVFVATITGKVSSGLFVGKKVKLTIKIKPKAGENCTPAHPVKHITFTNPKPLVIYS